MAGVLVNHQFAAGDTMVQLVGVFGGHHAVDISVSDEGGHSDKGRQLGLGLFAPAVDGGELGEEAQGAHGLIFVEGAGVDGVQEFLSSCTAFGIVVEEEVALGIGAGNKGASDVGEGHPNDLGNACPRRVRRCR